jgi:predicted Zn-dependent protease
MREAILRALERSRADYTEIRVEREWRTEVAYRKENLENLEASSELGGIVRCLVGGGWGIAVFNSWKILNGGSKTPSASPRP